MRNERFENFRAQLEAQGYSLRPLWGGKSHPAERYEDVTCYNVLTQDSQTARPAIGTIIIRHYDEGRNGYGIWFESRSAEISKDVERIIGDFRAEFEALEAALDYGSKAFEACSTSPEVDWRREDNDTLTRGREALERIKAQ